MKLEWNRGELAEGLRCYCAGEFFLAHEHWEAVWLKSEEPEKTFLQALIQVTAAFHHLQRNNTVGAASLLQAALRRLAPYPTSFGGIELAPLRDEIDRCLRSLSSNEDASDLSCPRIRLALQNN